MSDTVERVMLTEEESNRISGGKLLKNCVYNDGKLWSTDNPDKIYYYNYNDQFDGKMCIVAIDLLERREMKGAPDEEIIAEALRRGYIREVY